MRALYGSRFYDDQVAGSRRSAGEVVPYVLDLTGARSVVDVGCGVGTWLGEYARLGVDEYRGYDGAWVDDRRLEIPAPHFERLDLAWPPAPLARFELAQSLEVAEHLAPDRAEAFVGFLTALSDVVVFSAATPFQGGTHHVNEQWPSYWRRWFADAGYELYDVFRPRFWSEPAVEWWYAQNMFLYLRRGARPDLEERLSTQRGFVFPERIVHPSRLDPEHNAPPGVKALVRELPRAMAYRVKRMVRPYALSLPASR